MLERVDGMLLKESQHAVNKPASDTARSGRDEYPVSLSLTRRTAGSLMICPLLSFEREMDTLLHYCSIGLSVQKSEQYERHSTCRTIQGHTNQPALLGGPGTPGHR